MKLQINPDLLSDAPYNEKNRGLFTSVHKDYLDLVNDIQLGTSTCYLISGYRGAGKTSFIKKMEAGIRGNRDKENREILFVYTHFSKYHSQTYLLRKLIRGFYQQIKDLETFRKLKIDESLFALDKKTAFLLEQLYDKTFYDSSSAHTTTGKKERVTVLNLDFLSLLRFVIPILILVFFIYNTVSQQFSLPDIINYGGILISLVAGVQGVLKFSFSKTRTKTEQEDFNRKSMYDDEIADHHFYNLLEAFRPKYKVVFVLDELDKVDENDIDKLLNEMKPYLVSGAATFIVVAGQTLYYRYENSKSEDDALLSSIFAKCIHIPLLAREEFQLLTDSLILPGNQLTADEQLAKTHYVDWLVFQSKRVPRKFISLIRTDLHWEDGKAFLEINTADRRVKFYSQILDAIDEIDDKDIATEGFDEAMRDFLVMQLFLKSQQIMSMKKSSFSMNDLIKGYE